MGIIYNYFFPPQKEIIEEISELSYKNLQLYIKDTDKISVTNLPESKSLNNKQIYEIISEFQKKEKYQFLRGDSIISKYFQCEDKYEFESKKYLKKYIKITHEFRYFGLYFVFGNPDIFMLNFYYELFLNVNKMIGGSFYDNNMDHKRIILELKTLNKTIDWIMVIPCFHFPLIINEILKYNNIHSILVHCHGNHIHKEYFQHFPKYKGLFTNHDELIKKLKYINKEYSIPSFNYSLENEYIYEKYKFSLGSNIKSSIRNNLRNLYEKNYIMFDLITINFNTPNQLLFKAYLYYKDVKNGKKNLDFNEDELKFIINFIKIEDDIPLEEKLNLYKEFIPKLYLVCYYYLSYYYSNPFKMPINEVKKNINETNENDIIKLYISLGNIISDCYTKIIEGESILTKQIINDFHNILIKILIIEEEKINLFKYIECLSDFDFCLQLIFDILHEKGNSKIAKEIIVQMMNTSRRLGLLPYFYDIDEYNKTKIIKNSELNEKQINQFNEGTKINNILVIYESEDFMNSIKSLDLPYKEKNIEYIKKNELDNYFLEKNEMKETSFRIMKYYIITNIQIANELYNTFNFYIYNYGYSLVFVLLCQQNSLISKYLFLSGLKLSCICLYSFESIKEYFNDIKNVYKNIFALNLNELKDSIKEANKYKNNQIFIPMKATEEADNGFDIIKDINPCFFISNFLIRSSNLCSLMSFIIGMYELYKEKDGLDIYFDKYSKYLGVTSCFEEQISNNPFVKQVIYAYTREEEKNRAGEVLSFYCLINNDLRTGEFKKIGKYMPLLYIIKECIFSNTISTYNKTIYRGTGLKFDFIKRLKVGTRIFSPCFWSCSKNKDVALNFLKNYENKNAILILERNKDNNIDIDIEKLSFYPEEKEVLVIPFCSFEIKKIKLVFDTKEYYEITLEYILEKLENDKISNLSIVDLQDLQDN